MPSLLCHSIQHTSQQLAGYLDIPYEEIDWRAAGINHLAWFVELKRDGEDLYPLLREKARIAEIYDQDPVRFEMMLHLGAFSTEGSGHKSEYVPYFRKRADLVAKYDRGGYQGESGFYAKNWPTWRAEGDQRIRDYLSGKEAFEFERGPEFASYIMEAMETNRPAVIYGSVKFEVPILPLSAPAQTLHRTREKTFLCLAAGFSGQGRETRKSTDSLEGASIR